MMKIQPLHRYRRPRYPTQYLLNTHPELLRLVPARWRGNPVILSALAGVCVILASCRSVQGAGTQSSPRSLVAPLFIHGEGRGALGCIAVNPPVFLSEAEARQVIQEEAAKAGIAFEATDLKISEVNFPVTDRYSFIGEDAETLKEHPAVAKLHAERSKMKVRDIEMDGLDRRLAIDYEVVTQDDFTAWEKPTGAATAELFDLRETAERVRKGVAERTPAGVHAVFYDPMVGRYPKGRDGRPNYEGEMQPQKAIARSKEQLRAQVKDFIAWLKAQKVI